MSNPAIVAAKSPWLTIEGVALVVLGVLALILPLAAGVAAGVVIGWILIVSGIIGLVSAFSGRLHSHREWGIVSAAVALIVGLLILINPVVAAVGVTILLGAYLFVDGVALLGLAFDQRRRTSSRWVWLAASGVLDLVLAVIILTLNPTGAAFLIGLIVGVDLIAAGAALLLIHRAAIAAPRAEAAV
jgi:uncharacterized membrane protein HdeD (DUF308 family)